jgi:hypothetical protein
MASARGQQEPHTGSRRIKYPPSMSPYAYPYPTLPTTCPCHPWPAWLAAHRPYNFFPAPLVYVYTGDFVNVEVTNDIKQISPGSNGNNLDHDA